MDVRLMTVDENNMDKLSGFEVLECQKRFVPPVAGILARAWVYRKSGAELLAITNDGTPVGLMLVYEIDEEPACYYLMEMLIDKAYQGRGIGTEAVKQLIKMYSAKPKYPMIEVSVDRENAAAIAAYTKAGFSDEGYTDPDLPQYVNLVYRFKND